VDFSVSQAIQKGTEEATEAAIAVFKKVLLFHCQFEFEERVFVVLRVMDYFNDNESHYLHIYKGKNEDEILLISRKID
jgi:hypothetical protein